MDTQRKGGSSFPPLLCTQHALSSLPRTSSPRTRTISLHIRSSQPKICTFKVQLSAFWAHLKHGWLQDSPHFVYLWFLCKLPEQRKWSFFQKKEKKKKRKKRKWSLPTPSHLVYCSWVSYVIRTSASPRNPPPSSLTSSPLEWGSTSLPNVPFPWPHLTCHPARSKVGDHPLASEKFVYSLVGKPFSALLEHWYSQTSAMRLPQSIHSCLSILLFLDLLRDS